MLFFFQAQSEPPAIEPITSNLSASDAPGSDAPTSEPMEEERSQDSTETEEDDQEETMLRAQLLLSMAKKQERRIKDIEVSTNLNDAHHQKTDP